MLTTLDFTSERARMSVVARTPDGTLRLFCKGSDQALLARLRPGTDPDLLAATHGHLRRFSVQACPCGLISRASRPLGVENSSASRLLDARRMRSAHDTRGRPATRGLHRWLTCLRPVSCMQCEGVPCFQCDG